jgi:hypothetical protein
MQIRRRRAHGLISLLVCFHAIGACGDGPAQMPAGEDARRENPSKISLRFDPKLEAIGFHSPIVEGSIAGQSALFLIDTGASVHTFAKWFAEAARLDVQSSDSMVSGSTNKTSRVEVVSDIDLRLATGGESLHLQEAAVVDLPPIFLRNHIGGLLSPQLLAPEGRSTLIDLHSPKIRFKVDADGPQDGHVCVNEHSRFKNRLYAIDVLVANNRANMLVDSGATSTLLSNKSQAGKSLFGRAKEVGHMEGVGGAPSPRQSIGDVAIKIGKTSVSASLSLAEISPGCGADGILGMDVLRSCVIQLYSRGMNLNCALPHDP